MKITTLPKDLKIDTEDNLQLFNYRNPQNILKSKINLSKNTISFLRRGTKEVIGDDASVQIDNQQFLIMKSGNCLMTEKISNSNKIYKSILLFFSDEDVLEFLEKNKLHSNKLNENKSFYIFKYDNFIQHFVESLENILALPKATQKKILKTKFEEIMLYLTYQNGASFLNAIVQNVDDKVSRMANIVDNNKHNKLSLEELAFLSSMSVSTFKRAFFKQYQNTPMKWFNDQRLNHIAVLLRTKRKRPIELYEDAGYENFSNFVQAFKQKFGMTPKQYQNQV
ncbi:MAG: AraC-like DNA-binding protein [Maribacter sp.]|jgi:AraC-like DNA-binding protein